MSSKLVWGYYWTIFRRGWFCPIHLIRRKSVHFEKTRLYYAEHFTFHGLGLGSLLPISGIIVRVRLRQCKWLHMACRRHHVGIALVLLHHGCQFDVVDHVSLNQIVVIVTAWVTWFTVILHEILSVVFPKGALRRPLPWSIFLFERANLFAVNNVC